MTKNLSWYLDLVRLSAALAVLIGHAQGYILPSIPAFVASHAEEAVSGFFVLSGFVIMFVLAEKEKDWQSYLRSRFFRLYSVVPVALLATFLADQAGYGLNPAHYNEIEFFDPAHFTSLFSALTFTNEFWFAHTVFGSNEAYWSLSFEVAYYVAIGLFFFLPGPIAIAGAMVWLVIAGPKIALALPLWALGAFTYKLVTSQRLALSRSTAVLSFIGSLGFYGIVKLGFSDYKQALFHLHDIKSSLLVLIYYFGVSLAFALNIFSFSQLDRSFALRPPRFIAAIRWLAGGSFTLYLVHQPLLTFVAATIPAVTTSPSIGAVCLTGVVVTCYLLAEFGERRKKIYERAARALFFWSFPRARAANMDDT
jgi:peptidoglycan/LPS O-acetylase OafA/YrhL